MRFVLLSSLVLGRVAYATKLLDRNLVYRSPFVGDLEAAHDTRSIQARHIHHFKRHYADASPFTDESYPTYYGADFSASPYIWNAGLNFTHSVASGDPIDTSILLWTRAVPLNTASQMSAESIPVCVTYKIWDNPDLSGNPVDTGSAFTSADVDFTLKVEATGLNADSKYWYQFNDCVNPGSVSPIGATRTLASPKTSANEVNGGKPLTLAVFSCSQFQNGWFNAYGVAAHNISVDLFVHLGDYIYEKPGNGKKIGREVLGRELATIADYRQRYNQYRTDSNLIYAHQNFPWVHTWDDHEIADNAWKAGTADSNDTVAGCAFSASGACFTDRKLAGTRAYHEWMPTRQVDAQDKLRIWRNFQIGQLLDLTILDTRQYDRDITDIYYNTVIASIADDEKRSLMGPKQEKWLSDTLIASKARGAIWRIIGQQIVFTDLKNEGKVMDYDAWSGYTSNRERVLNLLYGNQIDNTVILAGDSHANWVSDLAHPNDTTTYNPSTGEGAIGVEFAGTAVTSSSSFGSNIAPAAADVVSAALVSENRDLQWSEGSYRGFFTLTIDQATIEANYYAMKNVSYANLDHFVSATFNVKAGANKLTRPVAGGHVLAGALKNTTNA